MKRFLFTLFVALSAISCNLVQKSNEIWYTTLNGSTITLTDPVLCGANLLSNTNKKGWGVLKFDAPVTNISTSLAAENTNLSSLSLPSGVVAVDSLAFTQCTALKSVAMFDKVVNIGYRAFYGCSALADITFSRNLYSISDEAFMGCGFIGITLPQSLTEIGQGAFSNSANLISATLSGNVTSIGNNAFAECQNLAYFYCKSIVPPTLGSKAFRSTSAALKIYVPNESLDLYKWSPSWREHKHRLVGFDFK